MKLIVRADDLGYSEGVNYGIYKSAKEGIINNIGLMVNMEYAYHGFQLIKDLNLSLGLHANISSGNPLTAPYKIPSLVNGISFKSSTEYKNKVKDIVVLDEAIMEIQNQVEFFIKIVGHLPKYIDFHAVFSPNFLLAIKEVAKIYNLSYIEMDPKNHTFLLNKKQLKLQVAAGETQGELLTSFKEIFTKSNSDILNLIVYHPGFIDADLLEHSSLTTKRAYEVAFLTNPILKKYIFDQQIELLKLDSL